jgi:hypothetical protein
MKLHGATPAQFALEDFVQFGHLRMMVTETKRARSWAYAAKKQLTKSIV